MVFKFQVVEYTFSLLIKHVNQDTDIKLENKTLITSFNFKDLTQQLTLLLKTKVIQYLTTLNNFILTINLSKENLPLQTMEEQNCEFFGVLRLKEDI